MSILLGSTGPDEKPPPSTADTWSQEEDGDELELRELERALVVAFPEIYGHILPVDWKRHPAHDPPPPRHR